MAIEKRQVSIVGSSFYPGAWNYISRLSRGQQLRVVREPDNKYDKNAISLHLQNQKLGHLPRGFAAEVAPLMDAGVVLSVTASMDPRFDGTGVMVAQWERPDAPSADAGTDQ